MERITKKLESGEVVLDNKKFAEFSREEEREFLLQSLYNCEEYIDCINNNKEDMLSVLSRFAETISTKYGDKSLDAKIGMYWGALYLASETHSIDHNDMLRLFGEFMCGHIGLFSDSPDTK